MSWFVKNPDGKLYGPASIESLIAWAKDGRIQSTSRLSQDRQTWLAPRDVPELQMHWLIEMQPGTFFGPFNRSVVVQLFKDGSLEPGTKIYRLHELAPDQDSPTDVKVVEKIVEVPVEKVVEKVVVKEVRVEVPSSRALVVAQPKTHALSLFSFFKPKPKPRPNLFANADPKKLAALEAALQSELKRSGMTFKTVGGVK